MADTLLFVFFGGMGALTALAFIAGIRAGL